MTYNLDGKTAIVTGGASGIGRKTAERFAAEGANVVVADVVTDGGEETVESIESAGGSATFVETDVTDPDAVEAMVQTAVDTYGGLDIAHNNAGIEGETDPVAEQTEANWKQVMDINLTGVWLCLKYELQEMTANGDGDGDSDSDSDGVGGAIVNTSSIAGLSAAGSSAYAASKHGVIGLTRVAATEYAEADVRVNAVCPGVIETPMVEQSAAENPEEIEQFVGMQPLNRMGTPEEIANAVVWLCSDEASFVTGNAYPVDGGFTAL
ncbi:putative oxidoreductase (short-chain dehydrogenase family) [Natrialba magadii ATCC 43099]|uniref:Oxidoreductase (Short-chain dehydrogenase family) n=1 Tax=Natrialba magadii (strain ATCC 43099 / DSM 3394 / CCM 3739 / CIP 104546 / IAM 13178 / JCM 8861 / NBRC 102185 / NCIMB 2190 / MS3) TaxID=547559 RepID=D3SYI5_NATMM|nr:glucose 1-dehydrogenase [Natrialba magadii]ADD04096.1 putative oxidoreductase (short-chain dehydrogenase family) [Natrialba magadii ATCC 43099]ELY33253.1 short-chain dehydrogenase/reductase SDR [Natrialba magadii ATCC 43099]